MSESMPMPLNCSLAKGCIHSQLSTRATVFLAPSTWARAQQVTFCVSDGVTAMKRSAWGTPASFSPTMEVGDALSVMRSQSDELRDSVFSGFSSMTTMS